MRPSPWWLVAPVALLVVGAVAMAVAVVRLLGLGTTYATLPVDGRPHSVVAPSGDGLMVFLPPGNATPDCRARDTRRGGDLPLRRVEGTVRREGRDGDEIARWQLGSGSGRLEVTCFPTGLGYADDPAAVGPAQSFGIVARLIGLPLVVSGLTTTAGLVWLVVLVVQLATRPRPRQLL